MNIPIKRVYEVTYVYVDRYNIDEKCFRQIVSCQRCCSLFILTVWCKGIESCRYSIDDVKALEPGWSSEFQRTDEGGV